MPSVCCFFFFKNPFILFSFLDIASTILKHMDQINGLSSGTRSAFLSLLRAVRARQMAMERVPMFSFLSFLFKEREREREKKKESGEILTPPNGCTRQNVKKSKNETQITRDSKKIETLRSCRGIKAVSTRYFRFFFLGCCFCCCRESVEKIPTGDKNHVFLALSVSVEGSNFLDKLQTQKKIHSVSCRRYKLLN